MMKRPEITESYKFINQLLRVSPLLFPRMLANFINSLILDYSPKTSEKGERAIF